MLSDKPYRGRFFVKRPDGTEENLSEEQVDALIEAAKEATAKRRETLSDEWLCNTCAHNMFAVASDTVRCGGKPPGDALHRALFKGGELYMRRVKSCAWYEKEGEQ